MKELKEVKKNNYDISEDYEVALYMLLIAITI